MFYINQQATLTCVQLQVHNCPRWFCQHVIMSSTASIIFFSPVPWLNTQNSEFSSQLASPGLGRAEWQWEFMIWPQPRSRALNFLPDLGVLVGDRAVSEQRQEERLMGKKRGSLFNSLWLRWYGSCWLWVKYRNMPKINGGIDDRQKRKRCGISQSHHSLPLIPPCLFFPSRSSVCSRAAAHCGQTGLRLLSSTCLLNDCNYFLRLRATHACFIPTSTSTICLYGKAWHTLWWDEKKITHS